MPQYKYRASDISGKIHKGTATYNNIDQLKRSLEASNLYLIDYYEYLDRKLRKSLKAGELTEFCRELSSLLGSGVTLVKALNIIIGRDMSPNLKYTFSEINSQIKKGVSLSDAMKLQQGKFPPMLINMVVAGEATGRLDDTMEKMADYFEKEYRLNKQIKSATTYPKILGVMTVLVVLILFTFVIPTFTEIFDGMEIPALTSAVLAISNFITGHYIIVAVIVVGIVLLVKFLKSNEKISFWFDKKKLKFPKVGKLLTIIYTARFARTLASLYSSGLTIINSLQIARDTIGNKYIASQFDDVIKEVRAGNPLSSSLIKIDGFDKKLSQTIAVGEETGQLDSLLINISDSYDYESEMATKSLITLIEPVMICVMAVIVVIVMLSVLLPIFGMYGQIENQGAVAFNMFL